MPENRQITLASRPTGMPSESNFKLATTAIPSPGHGEVLTRILWLSVDPYMRGRISDRKSYAASVDIGEVMVGGTVAEVIESKHASLKSGDLVVGYQGWQEYDVSKASHLRKVDSNLADPSLYLGALGMPGLTAYFGLLDICDPGAGETVFISGAAGAVGGIVGQIAKIKGCRVVGSAGSEEKVNYLQEELGFDAAFNYKTTENYRKMIHEFCPDGIDAYFDNVGGPITDAVMTSLKVHARVAICGQISQYNLTEPEMGPRWLGMLIVSRAKVQGFLVSDYADRFSEGISQLAAWYNEGRLKVKEDIVEGLDQAPAAFMGLMTGKNFGKMLVKVG